MCEHCGDSIRNSSGQEATCDDNKQLPPTGSTIYQYPVSNAVTKKANACNKISWDSAMKKPPVHEMCFYGLIVQ